MKRIVTLSFLTFFVLFYFEANAQITSNKVRISDDIQKITNDNPGRRSAATPTACVVDTVEYARNNATGLYVVTGNSGRGLAQFYGAPQKMTISGASFYAYISSNPPTPLKSTVYVNLYKAGSDSLPSGLPLRSDTITLDSTFGNGLLTKIVKHASFTPISISFDYIIAVETDVNDTLSMGIVANDWTNNNGKGMSFNAGSINGVWYRGRNLNVGGTPFDADILINPHVKYDLATDFTIVDQCFKTGTTVNFKNKNKNSVVSSIFYNYRAFYNTELYSHMWNYDVDGSPFSGYYTVDGQTIYSQSKPYTVRLATTVLQWTNLRACYDTAIYTIYPKPDIPSILGSSTMCEGNKTQLYITPPNGTDVRWTSDVKNDTSGYAFGDTLTTPALYTTTSFYARVSNGVCLSDAGSVSVPVYAYPAPPTVKDDSICSGSRATLVAISTGSLSMNWYKDTTGIPSFFTGNIYQTPVLNADTFFYVRASNYSCYSPGYVKVQALVGVNFAPQEPIYYGDTTVCSSTSPIVFLSATTPSPDIIRWFNQASGGSPIGTGTTYNYTPPTTRGTYNIFVEAWNGSCASSRIIATINVDNAPNVSMTEGSQGCVGNTAYVRASVPYGSFNWYDKLSGGNYISSDSMILMKGATKDSTLYIETFSGNCVAASRIPVTAVINTPPDFTLVKGDTICSKSFATLNAKAPYGDILWYENANDTIPFALGNSYTTPTLLGNIDYYINTRYNGCVGPMTKISVLVNASPFSGFFYDVLKDKKIKLTPLTTSGNAYDWSFGDGGTATDISPTHQYSDTGNYDVRLILTSIKNGCKDTTINRVYVPWVDNSSIHQIDKNTFKIYPNPSFNFVMVESSQNTGLVPLKIFTLNGQLVFENTIDLNSKTPIKVEHNLPHGLYFISIDNHVWKMAVE
ncbi:MAG: T9SS type A sorting domain-containing protein [Bacteroidia bacterium]|nr:T9SS type A sorting domain-containing protein [Bacteroidia bacterium]MCO5254823.1 PKD domain-containing protein [Bacteroidota bacterium]